MTGVLIVGAGLAAVRTAQELRRHGYAGEIVMLGAETHRPYDRPPLSKEVLRGTKEAPVLLTEEQQEQLGIELRLGERALTLDPVHRVVTTDAGEIAYADVVIASGAVPRRLPGEPGVALRTLEDSHALRDRLTPGSSVVVVGAGLIGCEVAASARMLEAEVHLVDVLAQPMLRVLGPKLAPRVADLHVGRGVSLHLGVGLQSVDGAVVTLTDGTVLHADTLLESLGAVPDVDWVKAGPAAEGGVVVDQGVVADERGRAADHVWVVGDASQWKDVHGIARRTEHWTAATDQAAVVAAQLAGSEVGALPPAYWWSDQYDVKIQGIGELPDDGDLAVLHDEATGRTVALASVGGAFTGAVTFKAPAVLAKTRGVLARGGSVDEARSLLPESYQLVP